MNLEKKGTSFSDKETFEADIFFKAVDLACEALIACASKIDNIDKFSGVCHYDRCGSKLANIAKIIKTKILNERIFVSPLSSIIFQIALIFEKNIHDPQAKLYSIFFNSFGKAIQKQENVQVNWIDAFVVAIDSIEKIAKDTKFFNILSSVKEAFYSAYAEENNFTIIHALNQAVTTAQNKTSHVILDTQKMSKDMFNIEDYEFSELAEAHAIGIWLRGAFEFLIFGDRCELIAGKALTGYNIHPVRYREYPNVVCIAGLSKNLLEEDVWCTGTMISYLHALTSEHCFDDVENEGFRLICGSNELFRGVSYYPEWWISFDQWSNAHNLEIQYPINDIAVIKLFGSIIPQIQPARLSSFTENSQLFGFRAITVGWGQTNRGAMPTVLQASNLTISTNTQCEKIYFELTGERRHLGERYICSSSFPYTHLGDGDSGGPLLYNGELIAINKGTTPNLPDFHHNLQNIHVFINVYRNFVDSVLSM